MISEQKIIKEQVTSFARHAEADELEIGNSRFGFGLIMAMAGFVGTWGCISLINGIVQAQNVQELGKGIFTALTGI